MAADKKEFDALALEYAHNLAQSINLDALPEKQRIAAIANLTSRLVDAIKYASSHISVHEINDIIESSK